MTAQALLALAERCEREEASRDLDAEIAKATGWFQVRQRRRVVAAPTWIGRKGAPRDVKIPAYTTSLDAAVGLVPEKWTPYLALRWEGDGEVYIHEWHEPCRRIPERGIIRGATPALALCAAALRARAALQRNPEA